MSRIRTVLVFLTLTAFPLISYAVQPRVGSIVDGGIFLHREAVEGGWDDWIAFPLMAKSDIPTSGQARATIIGDGKTASFIGNLSINCENGKHFWESAGSFSEFLTSEEQADEIVPDDVIKNAIRVFCR